MHHRWGMSGADGPGPQWPGHWRLAGVAILLCGLVAPWLARAAPPEGMTLVFAEECDSAALDERWVFEDGRQETRPFVLSSRWRDNVDTDGAGHCRIDVRREARMGKPWTAGHAWTRREFTYGWFEARLRLAPTGGVDNAFWLMSADRRRAAGQALCEIDVIEGAEPNIATLNLHVTDDAGTRTDPLRRSAVPRDAQGWGTYAVWWTADTIRWYWNGELVRERANPGCQLPLAVRMSAAVMRDYWGQIEDSLQSARMLVDYVRVYQPR